MECCQVVRAASRSIRPSLLQAQLIRQQQRFQSSSPSGPSRPNPNRYAIDSLLHGSPDKSRPVSRPSILSSPRGAGLSGMLPPRPPRLGSSSQNVDRLSDQIMRDAEEAMKQNKPTMTTWSGDEFKKKYGEDNVQKIRLSPSIGRIVHVSNKTPPAVAFDKVNKLASRNSLRHMSMMQREHERKALKRKRKLRDSWRMRFKKGFKAVVHRAMELRRQGW
ncbi:hypothetical protein V8F20_005516 [Naviculisporaceae sp. PSN 640]